MAGDGGSQEQLTVVDGVDAAEDLVQSRRFGEITGRAAVDRVADAHGVVQHRKHEHPGGGRGDEQPACGLDPAEARQTQVHEHDVRGVGDEPGKGGFSGAVRSDDAHAAAPGEDGFDALADAV